KEIEVVFVYGRADADQSLDPIIINAHLQSHPRAEREAAQDNILAGIVLGEIIQTRAHIVTLAVAFVMGAGALPDATKIDAKRNESCIIQSRGCAKNYFVVHRPAAEGMRMQH